MYRGLLREKGPVGGTGTFDKISEIPHGKTVFLRNSKKKEKAKRQVRSENNKIDDILKSRISAKITLQ